MQNDRAKKLCSCTLNNIQYNQLEKFSAEMIRFACRIFYFSTSCSAAILRENVRVIFETMKQNRIV